MLTFTPSPDRFVVEEIPAYAPAGEGAHTFLWVEKRGLTTFDAIARLATTFGVPSRDVGYAGMKDKQATTRQWLSINMETATVPAAPSVPVPYPVGPEVTVLAAARHPHKLRLGHLRGNRFEVVLTGNASDEEIAALRARFADVSATGVPNFYGGQRFGVDAANAARGLALLRGERREPDKRKRKLLMSALQSAVFNRVLELRASRGPLTRVIPGDVLKKTDTGGLFVSTEVEVDQRRVDAGELIPTAPLPGGREIEPPVGSAAHELEEEAIIAVGATRADFSRIGRDLPGARRPVLLRLADTAFSEEPAGDPNLPSLPDARAVRLFFTLPAGGYATVVVTSITGPVG